MKCFMIVFFCAYMFISKAQDVKFHGNPGVLLSQIDGDQYGGFRKLGYSIGGGFVFVRSKKFQVDWTTRINQKGAREVNSSTYFVVRLNYLETDLVFDYLFEDKVVLGLGVYYGFMLTENANIGFDSYGYRRSDIAPLLRLGVRLNDNLTIQSRLSYSLLSIRKNCTSYQSPCWVNRSLLFDLSYIICKPKKPK